MKRMNRYIVLLLTVVFALGSAQFAFAYDDPGFYHATTIEANKIVKGTLKKNDLGEYEKWFAFYSGGGSYKLRIYQKEVTLEGFEYGAYKFNSVNKGWQAPEYHMEDEEMVFMLDWVENGDGWYVCEVNLGKFKPGKRVGIGFTGDSKVEFKIEVVGKGFKAPAKPEIKSVKGKKRAMNVKWKKAANAKGYLIQISKYNGYGDNYKEIRVKGGKTVSKTIKKLKKGTYYVKICSYKKVSGVTAYSTWSKAKKVKVK